MMKKILILIIIFTFFLPTTFGQARFPDDLPGPKVMPDSPFYFLKIWYEKIVLFFTFDVVRKAERYKTFAGKRAYEAKEMLKQGKEELAEKSREIYKEYLNKARERLEKAAQKAMRQGKEKLQQELEQKVDEVKNKIKEAINLW